VKLTAQRDSNWEIYQVAKGFTVSRTVVGLL